MGAPTALRADTESAEHPAWRREGLLSLPDETCQELRVERAGAGLLELRFFTADPLPVPYGPDAKTSGASLLLAAADLARPSLALYAESGIYAAAVHAPAPLRWMRRGNDLCVASGALRVACGRTGSPLEGSARIAFGEGWRTRVTGCAPFPMAERGRLALLPWVAAFAVVAAVALRASRRPRDVTFVAALGLLLAAGVAAAQGPAASPSAALVPAGAIASVLLALAAALPRRRPWRERLPRIALALLVAVALAAAPHPVWVAAPEEPAVPQLWTDTADWHPRSPHQSLDFRGQPLAALVREPEPWLVLGGSVTFGEGVAAAETFTAVAQRLLRQGGDRRTLFNAGMQGWNLHHLDRLRLDLADALPLRGLVLVSILNNATLPLVSPSARGCERSLAFAYLCNAWRTPIRLAWPKVFLPKPANPERYRDTLRRLVSRERALGREVVLLDEISEFESGLVRPWDVEAYRAIAREVTAELGVPFHGVRDAVAGLPPDERFLDGVHPTAAMHARLGQRLAEVLREDRPNSAGPTGKESVRGR